MNEAVNAVVTCDELWLLLLLAVVLFARDVLL